MRQWHVPCECLCDKHLLGEHVEHHMFSATLRDGKSVRGYIADKLLWPKTLHQRHDEIAEELVRRGMKHTSPYIEYPFPLSDGFTTEDLCNNIREVARRCMDCRARVAGYEGPGAEELRIAIRGLPIGGDYYEPLTVDGSIGVYISGKLVGSAPTKPRAIVVMERTRKQMLKDGTIWL